MNKNLTFPLNEHNCSVAGPYLGLNGASSVNLGIGLPFMLHVSKLTCWVSGESGRREATVSFNDSTCRDYWFRFDNLSPGKVYRFGFITEDGIPVDLTGGLNERDQFFRIGNLEDPEAQLYAVSCHDPFAGGDWSPVGSLLQWLDTNQVMVGIQLGDQVYNDSVANWAVPLVEGNGDTPEVREKIVERLILNYLRYGSNPDYRRCFMQSPSLVNADDHDFYDGYGSRSELYLPSGELKLGYRVFSECAYRVFWAYQGRRNPTSTKGLEGTTTSYLDLGTTRLLLIDLRTDRNIGKDRIMSESHEKALFDLIRNTPSNIQTLVLAVPVVAVRMNAKFEDTIVLTSRILKHLKGTDSFGGDPLLELLTRDDIEDDILDGLSSMTSREYLARLMSACSMLADRGVKLGILAGDIHEQGSGELFVETQAGSRFSVFQVVTSPFTNEVKPWLISRLLGEQRDFTIPNREGVSLTGRNGHFIPARGFVSMRLREPDKVRFHLEGDHRDREVSLSTEPKRKTLQEKGTSVSTRLKGSKKVDMKTV